MDVIAPGEVHIWLCHLLEDQACTSPFWSSLSADEQARAERFKFDIHRQRFLVSHAFMRQVLAHYLPISPHEIVYKVAEKGKPYLDFPTSSGLQFNLSHAHDRAILAVAQNVELGIDIEFMQRKTDWQGIVKRFFTPQEQAALFKLEPSEQTAAFFELWTRKEAYMKVLGTGLSLSPTEFTLTVPPQAPQLVEHHTTKYRSQTAIDFKRLDLSIIAPDYQATLALQGEWTHIQAPLLFANHLG